MLHLKSNFIKVTVKPGEKLILPLVRQSDKACLTPPIQVDVVIVTYNNFGCLSYDYLVCLNLYVIAYNFLLPFYFRMFKIIPL